MQNIHLPKKVLLEIKHAKAAAICGALISIGLWSLGVYLFFMPDWWGGGLVFFGLALLFTIGTANAWGNKVECFEDSIMVHRWYTSPRLLKLDQVETVRYKAVKQYINGIPTGTSVKLVIAPRKESGKPIKISKRTWDGDKQIEALRDRVSTLIAEKMYQALRQKTVQRVPWAKKAELSTEGIHFNGKTFWANNGDPTMISFDKGFEYLSGNGVFELRIPGEKNNRVILEVDGPNFFPGVFLMERLLRDKHEQSEREANKERQGFNKSFFGTLATPDAKAA